MRNAGRPEAQFNPMLKKLGFANIRPGPVDWEARKKSVEDFLIKTYGPGPALLIAEDGAPLLIEGFNGGYQYPKTAIEIEPTMIRPLKNKFSHPHDGFQYLCWGVTQIQRQYAGPTAPPPSYGFQKR